MPRKKIYSEAKERGKKDKLFYLNRRKKPIITISKPFQPMKFELRKNPKWKRISKLPH